MSPLPRLRHAIRAGAMGACAVGVLITLGPVPAASASTTASVPVMIVLDASGSMNTADAPGPRIDAAKKAVTDLVGHLPADARVGLQVYGTATGSGDADKAAGCTDIKTLAPVRKLDAPALTTAVNGVVASGYTPIGAALRAAAAALPAEGKRSIVLVSDGQDTCAPPTPCDVAKELAGQGVDLTIHTVGFKVDDAARQQLSCIAQATHGTYSDTANADQLGRALQVKVDDAISGYTAEGTPVAGAGQPSEQAPLLTPGQYLDSFATGWEDNSGNKPGTTKYYTIPVVKGSHPYISATLIPPTPTDGLPNGANGKLLGSDITLLARDLQNCGTGNREFQVLSSVRYQPSTTVLDGPTFGGSGYYSWCPDSGVIIVKISRTGTAFKDVVLPMEIVVRMEPSASTAGLPAGWDKQGPVLASPQHGASHLALNTGTSFNNAPTVTSGLTYTSTLRMGETRYVRIPLDWGQRFSYTMTPTGSPNPAPKDNYSVLGLVDVDVFNPVRETVAMTAFDSQGEFWYGARQPDPFTASTAYPVRYRNREEAGSRNYDLDGGYYLQLSAAPGSTPGVSRTFLLTVVVSGTVEPGPVYGSSSTSATSSSSTSTTATSVTTTSNGASTTASASATSAPSTGPTTIPGSATTPVGTTGPSSIPPIADTAGGSDQGSSSLPIWVFAVVGVTAAGAGAAIALLIRRNRPTTAPGEHWRRL